MGIIVATLFQWIILLPAVAYDMGFRRNIFSIMLSNVAPSLLSTGTRNTCRVSRQMPPKTHCPSTNLPLWYLRLPNLASSTSTVQPPPTPLLAYYFRFQLYTNTLLDNNCSNHWQFQKKLAIPFPRHYHLWNKWTFLG